MEPKPKPYTLLERAERWWRHRAKLKRLARQHHAEGKVSPHPMPRWTGNEPVPWSSMVLTPEATWTECLTLARRYAKMRYGRELRPSEVATLQEEWYKIRRVWLRRQRNESC